MENGMFRTRGSSVHGRLGTSRHIDKKQRGVRSFLPDIQGSVDLLKEECEFLLKEEDCFQSLSPRIYQSPAVESRPMWTQLRAAQRKQRYQQNSRMRINSLNATSQMEGLATPPADETAKSPPAKLGSTMLQSQLSLRKNIENMPQLYRKGNMYFGSEPIKRKKRFTRKPAQRQKEFGTLVRQLRQLLLHG